MKSVLGAIAPELTQHLAFLTEPREVTIASPGTPCIWPGSHEPCPWGPKKESAETCLLVTYIAQALSRIIHAAH